LSWIYN